MFSGEYCEIFKNTCFEEHLRTAVSVLQIIKLVKSIGHLFNQKHDVRWFLIRRFADLFRVYSLLIISRNHFNTFLFLDLQKKEVKQNIAARATCDDIEILIGLDRLLSTT